MNSDTSSTAIDGAVIADRWLKAFFSAVRSGEDCGQFLDDDVWWRDLLALSGDFRSLTLQTGLEKLIKSAMALDVRNEHVDPSYVTVSEPVAGNTVVHFRFGFDTDTGRGTGIILLLEGPDGWRARNILTVLDSLGGTEPAVGDSRPVNLKSALATGDTWGAQRNRALAYDETDPEVVIIGAGHSGLSIAAWLGVLGVNALVIDRQERVGDNWRGRYDSLVLHDAVWSNHLPFMKFPDTWPVFTPKDKVGDWLESYATALDLNVWCGTTVTEATYDQAAKEWSITVDSAQDTRTLRVPHLILATGISGTEPSIPQVEGADSFTGEIVHSSRYRTDPANAGRKVVVVGSGNSGHDIAQDLHSTGADVTLIQRGPTHVVSCETISEMGKQGFNETLPTELSDLLFAATARFDPALMQGLQQSTAAMADADADLLEGLRAKGFALTDGEDGSGVTMLFLTRNGGYYLDVGASELIASGEIGVRSGRGVTGLGPSYVELEGGERVESDLVVFATGYKGIEHTIRGLLGDAVADQCHTVWGLDDEGELNSVWRRSGHEHLWIHGGNLMMSRFYSKLLALQIKADLVGSDLSRFA